MASMAAAGETLTSAGSDANVILTCVAGRTPMPRARNWKRWPRTRHAVHLPVDHAAAQGAGSAARRRLGRGCADPGGAEGELAGRGKIVRGTPGDIKKKCQDEKIGSQAMIVASPTLGAAPTGEPIRSKLYDPTFAHRFRKAAQENDHE